MILAQIHRKNKLRWFSFEFLRVRRKISSTPSYAYLRICVFSKEITALRAQTASSPRSHRVEERFRPHTAPLSSPPPSSCLVHWRHRLTPPLAAAIAALPSPCCLLHHCCHRHRPCCTAIATLPPSPAMTAAMAVAWRWQRAAFIVIGDIKGVE